MKWPNKQGDRRVLDELEQEEANRLSERDTMGSPLSPAERISAVFSAVGNADDGITVFRLTNWEMNWLNDNRDSKWPTFTPRMETVMRKIEAKILEAEK